MTTYCLLHNYNRAILLYPQFENDIPDIKDYYLNNDGDQYCIDFCTINLKHNDLNSVNTQKNIVEKLKQIIQD